MKTSFVFSGKRNYKKILEGFKSKVNLSTYDYDIIFLTKEKTNVDLEKDFPDISHKILIFDDYSTENEMVEYLFQNENVNNVVLIKSSYENVNFEDFNHILREANKGKEVIISKQNKQTNFFKKAWKSVKDFFIRFLFGFRTYNGEADLIYLSPLAVSIMKQSPKRSSMFTQMNTWSGIDVSEITITEQPKHKSDVKISKSHIALLSSCATIFLGMIVGHVLFATLNVNLPFLAFLAYILVEVVLFGFIAFSGMKLLFVKKHGKLNFINEAILTQTIDNMQ